METQELKKPDNAQKHNENFTLINGKFDFDEAREILTNAYNTKINFHKLLAWSKSERGDEGGDVHTARVLELEMEVDAIKQLLKNNYGVGEKISISCVINIEFDSDEEPTTATL